MTYAEREARRVALIEMARQEYSDSATVQIDDSAQLSEGLDNGVFVQAWVWVPLAGTQYDKEKT